jgi:hypothetical protein
MKKVIKLTESDLTKIVKRVLQEQKSVDNVSQAYDLMVQGSAGTGTSPSKIKQGLNLLKTADDFYKLNDMFKDKKSGYGSFDEMIKGEFELKSILGLGFNNKQDMKDVMNTLKTLKVPFTLGKDKLYKDFALSPKPVAAPSLIDKDWPKVKQYLLTNGFPPDFPKEGAKEGKRKELETVSLFGKEYNATFYSDLDVQFFGANTDYVNPRNYTRFAKWSWDGTKPVLSRDYKTDQTKKAQGYATTKEQILAGTHILGLGSRGDLVKLVQYQLNIEGSNPGNCGDSEESCDGIYGKKTKEAVRDMQIQTGLKGRNGIVGKETWNWLFY